MPIYEYKCPKCSSVSEIRMTIQEAEDSMPYCPTCLTIMNKIPSVSAFKFKGSGFYVNDYKKEGK